MSRPQHVRLVEAPPPGRRQVVPSAVLGMLITAGLMAISHRQGMGNEHMGRLGWIFGGLLLAGSAALLVNMVMG